MDDQTAVTGALSSILELLVGPVAISVGVLAVAGVGFLLLQGRLPARRAGSIALGCFILFSATTVARALGGVSLSSAAVDAPAIDPIPVPVYPQTSAPESAADPYGGAAAPPPEATDEF